MPTYDYLGINNLSQIPNSSWQIYQILKPKDVKTIPNHNKPVKYIIRKLRVPQPNIFDDYDDYIKDLSPKVFNY